jgi:enoyl-CoA hydratase
VPAILKFETKNAVAMLTLNRPEKLNALNNDLLNAIVDALDRIELDETLRAVVITGALRAFSAGADIAAFEPRLQAGPAERSAFHATGASHDQARREFSQTPYRGLNGLAFGGGRELVEALHMALASEGAVFAKAQVNIGVIPTFGGAQRLPRNVGRKAALELILSGREVDAAEAARLGLANRVTQAADLIDAALANLATKPPLTIAAALTAVHRGMDASIDDGLAIEEAAFARIVPTHDAQEGVAAFTEKRPPAFLGR